MSPRATSARKRSSLKVLEQRGDHPCLAIPFGFAGWNLGQVSPGLVHVISAMEACDAYKPWHDNQTHKTYLRPDSGKWVPIWSPFRLQFYSNGHSWLARQLTAAGIGFTMADNAFARIDDWRRAQDLADGFSPDLLHRVLEPMPHNVVRCSIGRTYHWSLMQVEYASDLVFRSAATLGPLYEQLIRQSVLSVKVEQIATFLGRQITPQLAQELGSQFSPRIERTCIKHRFGDASIKMYDKVRPDPSHRDHHQRRVLFQAPPEGGTSAKAANARPCPRQKSINRRYLEHLSALDDFSAGVRVLDRLTKPRRMDDKTVRGINFFDPVDSPLLHALQDPRVSIAGSRRADLLPLLDHISPPRLSRQIRRLRDIGVIKRVAGTYRYSAT